MEMDRLNTLFGNKVFLEKNKDKGTFEELYAAVKEVEPSITEDELDAYLQTVSEQMHATVDSGELSEENLENVAGGSWAVVAGLCGLLTFCYKAGQAIGEGIYNYSESKKNKKKKKK